MLDAFINCSEKLSFEQIADILDMIERDEGEVEHIYLMLSYITLGIIFKMKTVNRESEEISSLDKRFYELSKILGE